ncbi:hypothetical protein [Actinomadura miaoliensis]|uniref:hypothetical protein n=1 Tax=Actinomadura miaoliensis TaxID=430685 RepID=UPI0031E7F3A3
MRAAAADLDPIAFALVMATGILSIGLGEHGLVTLSRLPLWIAAAAYGVLVALTGWRLAAFRPRSDPTWPIRCAPSSTPPRASWSPPGCCGTRRVRGT